MTGYDLYMHSSVFAEKRCAGDVSFTRGNNPVVAGKTVCVHDGLPREGEFGPESAEVQKLVEKQNARRARMAA